MVRKIAKCCCECSKALTRDEIALSKKLIGRNINEFFCIDCLAEYIDCSVEDLEVKILEFKEQGCALFL
ncbi:hypothetical protein UF75_3228 [Desulfosporosinus sp. I2]|uniref:hypothetical protein n=1 Tax=Desulfosporosinus sp. I2 TaxID=1617025 RepID=UPI00061F592C|nr:hypothetical protein [Desulfosporosinus sp. I2]KJR46361.1 hypothetical protein UF75_3228 [Desulfosporosinus sp. I2]